MIHYKLNEKKKKEKKMTPGFMLLQAKVFP
jgi:hypothetical protein